MTFNTDVKIKFKRKKKSKRQLLIKDCDDVFSLIVRAMANNTCEKCGTQNGVMQCSHVHSRTYLSIRWDTKNANCLCLRCHIYWFHKNPIEAVEWFKEKYGQERLDYLNRQKQYKAKYSVSQLQLLLIGLREELKKVKG